MRRSGYEQLSSAQLSCSAAPPCPCRSVRLGDTSPAPGRSGAARRHRRRSSSRRLGFIAAPLTCQATKPRPAGGPREPPKPYAALPWRCARETGGCSFIDFARSCDFSCIGCHSIPESADDRMPVSIPRYNPTRHGRVGPKRIRAGVEVVLEALLRARRHRADTGKATCLLPLFRRPRPSVPCRSLPKHATPRPSAWHAPGSPTTRTPTAAGGHADSPSNLSRPSWLSPP